MISIVVLVPNPKLISVNSQYMHPVKKTKTGKYTSYVAPTPYLKEVQKFYDEKLGFLFDNQVVQELRNHVNGEWGNGLSVNIEVGMPQNAVLENDTSNYIKAIEDCVSKHIGIDDVYNLEVKSSKSIYDSEDNSWMLRVTISSTVINHFTIHGDEIIV